jgi:hypothetical protein
MRRKVPEERVTTNRRIPKDDTSPDPRRMRRQIAEERVTPSQKNTLTYHRRTRRHITEEHVATFQKYGDIRTDFIEYTRIPADLRVEVK